MCPRSLSNAVECMQYRILALATLVGLALACNDTSKKRSDRTAEDAESEYMENNLHEEQREEPDADLPPDADSTTDGELHDVQTDAADEEPEVVCTPRASMRCDGESYYWYDSCEVRGDLVEACLGMTSCRELSVTEARCCLTSTHTQCHEGDVYWFDECDFPETIAEQCPDSNAQCVNLSDKIAECRCVNHWSGDTCDICPGNWDEAKDCGECVEGWTSEDCTVHSDIFLDPLTGLMWQIEPSNDIRMWQESVDYCDQLDLAGHTDWRMPSISELRSIVRGCYRTVPDGTCGVTDECHDLACYQADSCDSCGPEWGPDEDGCYWWPELASAQNPSWKCFDFWSSSEFDSGQRAWFINFNTGAIEHELKRDQQLVRCVRGP